MPAVLVVALAVAGTWHAARAPLRRALALLVGVVVLVPATLVVPNGLSSLPTVHRLVLAGVAWNLVRRMRSGELWLRPFFLTPVHLAFAAFAAVALVCGVALAAPVTSTAAAGNGFLGVVDQAAFFVVVLACLRAIDDRPWAARTVAAVLAVSVGVGLVEHVLDWSWGRFLFGGLGQAGDASQELERRLGQPRSRAGAQFALQYAWVCAALLPVGIAGVRLAARRRVLVAAGVALVPLAVAWSWSRSAIVGLVLAGVLLWLLTGDRAVRRIVVAGGLAALLVAAMVPSLVEGLSPSADEGSIDSRIDKLPAVLAFVADDPLTGLGFNGLDPLGVASTDNSFVLAYAELGVVGVVALAALLACGLVSAARGLRRQRGADRLVQGACVAGIVTMVWGANAFDALSLGGSTLPLWLLVALGTECAEERAGRWQLGPARPLAWRAALPLAGVLLGLVLAVAAPARWSYTLQATVVPQSVLSAGESDLLLVGRPRVESTCEIARTVGDAVQCRGLEPAPGLLHVRFEGGSALEVERAAREAFDAAEAVVGPIEVAPQGNPQRGRPTGATTAPVWLGLAGLALAVLLPGRVRDRSRERVPVLA